MNTDRIRFVATPSRGEVSGLLARPAGARALLVLAHGAGAGMEHPFMAALAEALAARQVATFRYQFPYFESGRKSPDPVPVLEATVRAAVAAGARVAPDLPRFAGGKSMGGRMTSRAAAADAGLDARGIVFMGFPLHAAGAPPNVERAAHLAAVPQPMLFLQGTRDALADLELMRGVCAGLAERATLHVVDGADHGFHVPKPGPGRRPGPTREARGGGKPKPGEAKRGEGRDEARVLAELADVTAQWIERRVATG